MRQSKRTKSTTGRWLLASSVVLALLVSPFAFASGEGGTLKQGARNPSSDETQALTKETEIIANSGTYGTRQSNKSDNGGGAIYGCRSKAGGTPAKNEPCIRANNLADGLAFEYETNGVLGGTINVAKPGDAAKPFTTNATGVATGLNADRVDSKSADEIATDGAKAAVGSIQAGLLFAQSDQTGKAGSVRGVSSVKRTATGTYEVLFANDVSACALQATETTNTDSGAASTDLGADKKTVTVATRDNTGAAADRPFHISAIC
jgi:hypothetical protein